MIVDALNTFTKKLALLNDTSLLQKLSAITDKLEKSKSLDSAVLPYSKVGDVYTSKLMHYVIYFSLINDTIIFMDIISSLDMMNVMTSRNPRYNTKINPKYNTKINPRYNTKINPRYNTKINPKYNTQINPKYNTRINPKYNTKINPRYNKQIDPKYNNKINPHYNNAINPRYNNAFSGLYVFDKTSATRLYFVVSAMPDCSLLLVYDNMLHPQYYCIKREAGYCIYGFQDLEYAGHWESNGETGYNWFNQNSEWLYFVV